MSNFKEKYNKEIVPELMKEFGFTTVMAVPKLEKIIINIGVGEGSKDEKFITAAVNDLTKISGQKPVVTKARKSIAGFKIRDGQPVGVKVTLRGENMYYFFEKLVKVALPRVRDFRGVSAHSFDGHGNYTLGIKEQLIFPEVEYDDVVKVRGMDIVFVTTAKSNEEAKSLLKGFGMPFKN
ncbi:MAG: 50S ribosomal protein L5 [Bacilli bacterium]